jgi:hypothetical protein
MQEYKETPTLYRRWARVRNWQQAAKWIEGGRSSISRPLYHHSLGIAYADPENKNSDIVINYRWRQLHQSYQQPGEYIVKFTKDGRTFISASVGCSRAQRRIMEEYANLVSVRWDYYSKSLVIRQPDDPINTDKGLRKCHRCSGSKKEIFTCTQGWWSRPDPNRRSHNVSYECTHYDVVDLRRDAPHLTTADCTRCEGKGKTIPLSRIQSFKWRPDNFGAFKPLEVDPLISKLILEEELCTL